ncbi:MAG: ABC transporter substrate-binding protein [Clostridiales bacterium]|nr:ABC transporter substrate-binding protein [Clostridiales bacterium]
MKKKLLAATLCAAMTAMTACSGGSSGTSTTAAATTAAATQAAAAETEAAAAEEASGTINPEDVTGKVMIYTSMYEDIIEAMDEKLEEVFPNADIEFFYGGTGTLQSKVAAELDAGKLGCDMLMVAEPAYSLELKEAGVLFPHEFAETDKLLFEYDEEGYWYPVRVCNMVLAYNPEKVSKDSIPNTLEGFATDTSLKGKISMSNPLTSGTAYASIVALLDAYGEDYFASLGQQEVAIESGSVALTKLETGECSEIMILEESVLKKREEEGSLLEVIYPTDGTITIPSTIMIVNDDYNSNANTAACEAIEDWFLSSEGQKYIVSGWMHSVRSDYPDAPYDAIPTKEILENVMPVDWEKCFHEREDIRTMFQENVTVPQ